MATPPMHPQQVASEDEVQAVHRLKEARDQLRREIAQVVIGQGDVLDQLLTALLCRGHALDARRARAGQDPDGAAPSRGPWRWTSAGSSSLPT